MAGHTELVAVGIAEVCAVVVFVILGPHAWRTFRRATVRKCNRIDLVDDGPAFCKKRNHLAVSALMGLIVVGFANEEERPWTRRRLPARPGTLPFAEARLDAKRGHQRLVEGEGAVEVGDADEDV